MVAFYWGDALPLFGGELLLYGFSLGPVFFGWTYFAPGPEDPCWSN